MATFAVLGASGYTGRLVVAECLRQGHHPVVIGRDPERVRAALATDGHDPDRDVAEVRRAEATDLDGLQEALAGIDVLLTTVGPFVRWGSTVLDAALAAGTHYVDCTGEQSYLRWVIEERASSVRDAQVVAVPAAGFEFLPGDLLAAMAAAALYRPRQVHVAYTVPSTGRSRRRISAGTRRTIAGLLGHRGVALEHGELVEELPFEQRRLAWFPRPVGPRHAAAIPGGECLTVPRHVPGVTTVRTYFAIPSWKAEVAQMGANVTRWGPARRVAQRVLEGGPEGPSPELRSRTRWGCVAEVEGAQGVARAWAYGHDIYGLTATGMVAVADALVAAPPSPGVHSPATVVTAGELLDTVAARSDLRWSIARPDPG